MEIELIQAKEQATSAANEEQSLQYNRPTSGITAQEVEPSPSDYGYAMDNSSTPQQQQQPQHVAVNIDNRFGASCATVLSDANIVNNIIEASKKEDHRQWLYDFVGCIPAFALTCVIWIIWGAMGCSSSYCDRGVFLYYFGITLACLTGLILLWAIYYGLTRYSNVHRYEMLRSNVRFVIKLEGDKWTRYVDYLYGSTRRGFDFVGTIGGVLFCCRKSHYEKLTARGYGYIVFCQQGFLLDEMYHIVRNAPHVILKVVYVTNTGLRLYLIRKDGIYTVHSNWSAERKRQAGLEAMAQQTVPFDIYLPEGLSERLLVLLALQVQPWIVVHKWLKFLLIKYLIDLHDMNIVSLACHDLDFVSAKTLIRWL